VRTQLLRLTAAVTAGAGVGLLVAVAVSWRPDRSTPGAFGVTSVAGSSAMAGSTPARSTPAGSTPAASSSQPVPTASGPSQPSKPAGTPPVAGVGAPVTLAIPSLQVRAKVVPVVSAGGTLAVPDDPAQVGWWSASAPAGSSRGSVVIDGHVDSAVSGPGALFRLAALRVSDRIVLTTGTGAVRNYVVTGRRVYRKAGGLPADIFDQLGAPRLVLISCGGPFDPAAASYLDNIVVFAAPA
jgi:hypothetical protein